MNVIVYPRGFIGDGEGLNLVTPKAPDAQDYITAAKLNQQIITQTTVYASNQDVNDLFLTYNSGSVYTKSFEFREQVIKVALKAFGTTEFNSWCQMQKDSPFLSAMHRKFLNETINFVNYQPRQVNMSTWGSLLGPTKATETDKNIELNFDENLNDLKDVIQQWFTIENGVSDLVQTLNILFGSDA